MYLLTAEKNSKAIRQITILGIVANVVLAVLKLTLGLLFDSKSVLSDAVHSFADTGTSAIVLLAIFVGSPHCSQKFNYGREKVESLFVLFFSIILATVGVMLVIDGTKGLFSPKSVEINFLLYFASIFSIVVKELMYWLTIRLARKTGSSTLKADAWHHRLDSLSSVAVLIGLVSGSFLHSDLVENIAVLVVSAFVLRIALMIFFNAVCQLVDRSASTKVHNKILQIICEVENVKHVEKLQTRLFGNTIFADAVICVNQNLTAQQIFETTQQIRKRLETSADLTLKHCTLEITPAKEI